MEEEQVAQNPSGEEQVIEEQQIEQPPETPEEGQQTETQKSEDEEPQEPSHSDKSWYGRKLKETRDQIVRDIQQKNQELLNQIYNIIPRQQQTSTATQPQQEPEFDPYNPQQVLNLFDRHQQKQQEAQQQYRNSVAQNLQYSAAIDTDLQQDQGLMNEVLNAARQINLLPNVDAKSQAEYLIRAAKSQIYAGKLKQKTNPYQGKPAPATPVGGVQPPATPPKKTVKAPTLDEDEKKLQRIWGFSEERVAEILNS